MNFSEFKQQLGAEPRKTAAERADDIARDPQWSAATDEALALESGLEQVLRSPQADDELLQGILAIPARSRPMIPPAWMAIAASVLLVVGLSSVFFWQGPSGMPVDEYVRFHYGHDGQAVLASARESHSPADVAAVFASLGVEASPRLAEGILFIKFCPTPEGKGAHMVVQTSQGPATVIYMPSVHIDQPLLLSLDHIQASVIGLDAGAAAIIGADERTTKQIEASFRAGLKPITVGA